MAGRAVSITRIRHVVGCRLAGDAIALAAETGGAVVALEANGENHRTLQQPRVHRTVWRMTDLTPIDAGSGVFENEGAALVDMALQTGLLVLETGFNHMRAPTHFPSWRVGTVGVMAVRTVHKPFVHPVFERLRELRADVIVATVADFALPLREQVPGRLGLVNRMAGCATDVGLRVCASPDIGPIGVFCMAPQAGIQHPTRRQLGEGDDGCFAALCLNVAGAGTVAALTTGILRAGIPCNCSFVVRIPEKLERNIGMARATGGPADVA